MRVTKSFIKTSREAPSDEKSLNAQLLIRAGFVFKNMAGVYSYTPLGLTVLENIKAIVREEMNSLDADETAMASLQRKDVWQTTDRWSDENVDIWFKSALKDGTEVGFGWSHEEPAIEMVKGFVQSYRNLPVNIYQFQNKFRNELRSKSGIMRTREFLMKDMYSFSASAEQHDAFYAEAMEAYKRVYKRLGLGDDTYVTHASGGAFTEHSHEFQTVCETGEDTIYVNRENQVAINEEVFSAEKAAEFGLTVDDFVALKSVEVGNIFSFGTHKSEQMGLNFLDSDGQRKAVHLGSYGIGITRLMGVIAEKFADDKGLVWPESIAPAQVYLIGIGKSEEFTRKLEDAYKTLKRFGIKVIFDDRSARPGAKFADAELLGIPYRVTMSERLNETKEFEFTTRSTSVTETVTFGHILDALGV